jgi:hypothetical protein
MAITLKTPPYNPGETVLTVTHTNEAGTVIGPFALTESGSTGIYSHTRTIAQMPVGYYVSQLFDNAVYQATYATRVVADDVAVVVGATVDELRIWDTIEDLATTGTVTVVSPVDANGRIAFDIVIGDDYLEANSDGARMRHFEWTVVATAGVTAETATCKFGGDMKGVGGLVTGTITVDGANWILKFDLPKTATEDLEAGYYAWSVKVYSATGTELTQVKSDRYLVKLVEGQA